MNRFVVILLQQTELEGVMSSSPLFGIQEEQFLRTEEKVVCSDSQQAQQVKDTTIHRFHSGEQYLVIFNVSKKNNIKSLIYTAAAYSFVPIVVGVPSIVKDLHVCDVEYLYYASFKDLKAFLSDRGIPLVAIEIMDGARSILENPFHQSVAFMPGNEVRYIHVSYFGLLSQKFCVSIGLWTKFHSNSRL